MAYLAPTYGTTDNIATRSQKLWRWRGSPTLLTFVAFLTGLEFFFVGLLSAVYFSGAFKRNSISVSKTGILLILLAVHLCISAVFASSYAEFGRIGSSIYSIFVILSAAGGATFLINYVSEQARVLNPHLSERERVLLGLGKASTTTIRWFGYILIIGVIYFLATRNSTMEIPTLMALAPGKNSIDLLQQLSTTEIYRMDWGFGSFPFPRFNYLSRWATAGALIVGLVGNVAALYAYYRGRRFLSKALDIFTIILILSTLTRTVAGLYIVSTALVWFSLSRNKGFYVMAGLMILPMVFLLIDFSALASFRSYSTNDRFGLYSQALELASQSNPIFGLGFKPKTEEDIYAIGSHSMVLSFMVRGGAVAPILAIIALWIIPAAQVFNGTFRKDHLTRMAWPFAVRGLATFFAWSVFQEVDTSVLTLTVALVALHFNGIMLKPERPPTGYEELLARPHH